MKKILIMLILFFICGFVSADLCIGELNEENILLKPEVYESYARAEFAFKDIFWNIVYERLKLFLMIVLLIFTPVREKLPVILLSMFSFLWGFFFMSSITQLGLAGLVLSVASVFPHGLLYAGTIAVLMRKGHRYYYQQSRKVALHIGKCFLILLMFFTGCILEGLVATHFVPWVIRLALI